MFHVKHGRTAAGHRAGCRLRPGSLRLARRLIHLGSVGGRSVLRRSLTFGGWHFPRRRGPRWASSCDASNPYELDSTKADRVPTHIDASAGALRDVQHHGGLPVVRRLFASHPVRPSAFEDPTRRRWGVLIWYESI